MLRFWLVFVSSLVASCTPTSRSPTRSRDTSPRPEPSAPIPTKLVARDSRLTPWETCAVTNGVLTCRIRSAAESSPTWTLPAARTSEWRFPSTDVQSFSGESKHGCAVTRAGEVWCWSAGNAPLRVDGLRAVQAIASTDTHACALDTKGRVACFGQNDHGALGDGGPSRTSANGFLDIAPAIQIVVASHRSCVVTRTKTVVCWGAPLRPDGAVSGSSPPHELSTPKDVERVALGPHHACFLLESGAITCAGRNAWGELDAMGLVNMIDVTVGTSHSCALVNSGVVACWGGNFGGQLGNAMRTQKSRPMTVAGLNDAVAIEAVGDSSCARRANGEIVCWGFDPAYESVTGRVRARRPSRVNPEPTPDPPEGGACPNGSALRLDLEAWKAKFELAASDENERARVLEEIALPVIPSDLDETRVPNEPYRLERVTIDHASVSAAGADDLVVHVVFKAGSTRAGRIQFYSKTPYGHCPLLARQDLEDSVEDCGFQMPPFDEHPSEAYRFVEALEARRDVIVFERRAVACGGKGSSVGWERSLHIIADGRLSPSLLTVGSWLQSDAYEGTRRIDKTFDLVGAFPKQVVVKETSAGCNDELQCTKNVTTQRIRYVWDGKGWSLPKRRHR